MKTEMRDKEKHCYLSIIIPTFGRKDEVRNLLESIAVSRLDDGYEVLVIDQNTSGMIDSILKEYSSKLPVVHYKVSFKGVSKARNFGIEKAKGDIVCFPDDDAEYTKGALKLALKKMKKGIDCVFGKTVDKKTGQDSIIHYQTKPVRLSLKNHAGTFVEPTMFIKRDVVIKYMFDESMGPGCIYGAEEGYDIVYRMLTDGIRIHYYPQIILYHPLKTVEKNSDIEVQRAFYYSCGHGHLCKKHGFKNKYRKRMLKLTMGIPIIAIVRHKELKYFTAQWMGLRIGYKYI